MTEATGGGGRAEMERRLIERSLEDEDFRQRLLDDPKAAVEQELGKRLPEGVRGKGGGGERRDHLPGASQRLAGRRRRRALRRGARAWPAAGWRVFRSLLIPIIPKLPVIPSLPINAEPPVLPLAR